MTALRDIANKILRRSIELMVASDGRLTYDAARRKAAKQVATIEKLKPRPVDTKPNTKNSSSLNDGGFERGSSRHELLSRINLMAARILQTSEKQPDAQLTREPAVRAAAPPHPHQSASEPGKGVLTRLIGSATGSKTQDEAKNPVPEPYPYDYVYTGRHHPTLISDDEYQQRWINLATENWRRSLNQTPAQRQPSDDDLDVSSLKAICAAYDQQQRKREENK